MGIAILISKNMYNFSELVIKLIFINFYFY